MGLSRFALPNHSPSRARARTSAVHVLIAATLVVAPALAGCATERPPPIFLVEEIRSAFDGDLVVFNVTVRNVGNVTIGGPGTGPPTLFIWFNEWARNESLGSGPAENVERTRTETILFFLMSGIAQEREPRYYSRDAQEALGLYQTSSVGPIQIPPGERFTTEFAFLPEVNYTGGDGYYTVEVIATVTTPGDGDRGETRYSPCFNRDTAPYYGPSEEALDCVYWDRTGAKTKYQAPMWSDYSGPEQVNGSAGGGRSGESQR